MSLLILSHTSPSRQIRPLRAVAVPASVSCGSWKKGAKLHLWAAKTLASDCISSTLWLLHEPRPAFAGAHVYLSLLGCGPYIPLNNSTCTDEGHKVLISAALDATRHRFGHSLLADFRNSTHGRSSSHNDMKIPYLFLAHASFF